MPVVGRLHQVWVFPVKSMRGQLLPAAQVTPAGLAHDRAWAVVDTTGSTISAAEEPTLRQVAARVVDGVVVLDLPGAAPGLTGAAADQALSDWLGRTVRLDHRGDAGFVDVAPVHVVSTLSMTDSAHAEECEACDIRAPRANLVLELTGDGGSERDWVGRKVALGTATLDVVRRPDHCLGVYADVLSAGRVAVGEDVSLA
jgi:uncharacterized protein YcbX